MAPTPPDARRTPAKLWRASILRQVPGNQSAQCGGGKHGRRRATLIPILAAIVFSGVILPALAVAGDYTGPLIDAHSHVPNVTAIDAYVEALKRHNISKVVLLGVGGVRKNDPAWIAVALASETGTLDPQWKALIEKVPDRFLMGIDIWAIRLFEPKMLDRVMGWTRRILGDLKPEVAERVGYRNAAALFHVE